MDEWLVLGLLAAVVYAVSGIAAKVALGKDYLNLSVSSVVLLALVGVVVVFLAFYAVTAKFTLPKLSPYGAAVGIAIGFFWALGSIIVYYALLKGADVSRMAPIYNLNTIIVVFLAILLLKEIPDKSAAFRVVVGAVLITLGGILVSI